MTQAVLTKEPVGKKKSEDEAPTPPSKKQARFELRVEQAWLDRVEAQASRFGLTTAAYIRQATQIKLEADEAAAPEE